MNKLTKALLVAGSVAVLAACGSSNKTENGNGSNQTFWWLFRSRFATTL